MVDSFAGTSSTIQLRHSAEPITDWSLYEGRDEALFHNFTEPIK